ncbi:MAG: hypothetical protein H6591_02320 [Flavobacteriales bacterium]|nr:hypothetical protein [Flavobacteriales bacterium]
MRHSIPFFAIALFLLPTAGSACSCFGPQTFCQTLNPQPPQFPVADWWTPSDVVLLVKLNSYEYGADMKVVQVYHGDLQPEQPIRVWGDCGLLCRHYVDGVGDGDTVLWALRPTDLTGNGSCGTSLEEAGDYQLSICGIYWLDYGNGIVSGAITQEDWSESMPISEFAELVNGCLPTAVPSRVPDDFQVLAGEGRLRLQLSDGWADRVLVRLFDASGRVLLEERLAGRRGNLPLPVAVRGLAVLQVSDERQSRSQRLLME